MSAATPTVPACQGSARFDTLEQATYVAQELPGDVGGEWTAVACEHHWHVFEIHSNLHFGRTVTRHGQ